MKEVSCGQHGCLTTHHYFWDGELIFIFSQNSYWAGQSDFLIEHRTYFKNGKMFRCLEKEVSTTNGEAKTKELAKKTPNQQDDCKSEKLTPNHSMMKTLTRETAKSYFCQ